VQVGKRRQSVDGAESLYSVAIRRLRGAGRKADHSMSDVWARLEGHAVNGVYPLLRYLGRSNHSVVFLTRSAQHGRSELALKLVPAVPALARLQLARWRASIPLIHPRLIQLFEAGQCQIGERHFLYVLTDYADQNLAQLLERRALTEDETREMLEPVLEALAFLHEKKLVQGRLKPSNVLVVGDQLRLASDTIRPFSDSGHVSNVLSAYVPPEAREGTRTAASDVWGLGVTLCEALTRKQPSGLHSGEMMLPAELSPAFRGVVARCLNRQARSRPTVSELQVWARGAQLVASLSETVSRPAIPDAESFDGTLEVIGDARELSPFRAAHEAPRLSMRLVVLAILGALTLFMVCWAAIRSF
jgi:serine/threonine protein kinase